MGCGHSKINIYPKRNRNKNANNSKKCVTPEKLEPADGVDQEAPSLPEEPAEECDKKNTIKVKPYGGPLVAHPELSASQNNFFKMLDEKIESGPDYDSGSEQEKAMERERLTSLMKDWETASAGSRSLPVTPKRRVTASKSGAEVPQQRAPNQSVIHQAYGVAPFRQAYAHAPIYQALPVLHYQQASTQPPPPQYPLSPLYGRQLSQQAALLCSSPVKSTSPRHAIPTSYQVLQDASAYSPKMYKSRLTNGDLIQQQLQFQQTRDFPHLKASKEQQRSNQHQQIIQQQQQHSNTSNSRPPCTPSIRFPPIAAQSDNSQYDMT